MSDLLERLRAELGAEALAAHAPRDVDGVAPGATLRPGDGAALAAALRVLDEAGAAALVCGAGTRLGFGNPPARADLFVATDRLSGIDELDADEGVAHAGAGTKLATLREAASAAGWELPLDAPTSGATLGGALAQAALGPRLRAHGPPRDHLLGLEVVLASGARTRAGGRVVKNVTGYDLMKLHTGACGTLGVIEAAWVRLRPRPLETALLVGMAPAGEAGFALGLAAARLACARAVALVDGALAPALGIPVEAERRPLLLAELGGAPGELRRAQEEVARGLDLLPAPEGSVDRLRELLARLGAGGLRFRVAALPGRLAAAAAPLAAAGAGLVSFPGVALLWAGFPLSDPGDPARLAAAWGAAQRAARAGGGSFVLESGPLEAKRGRDVFGEPGDTLALVRALKARFDPRGVLNPGRFAGGV